MPQRDQADTPPPRERILEAATAVFAESGYDAGSLTVVAERAGVSRQLLLHYFPNKKHLLTRVLENRDLRFTGALTGPSEQTLLQYVATLPERLAAILDDRVLLALAHRLSAEAIDPVHPAHEWIVRRQQRVRDDLDALLLTAAERGELRAGVDTGGLSAVFLAAVEGLESQWLLDASFDHDRAARSLQELVRTVVIQR